MTVDSSKLKFILENTPASQNIMLVGKHGIGKSRILEEYYASKNQKVVTLFLGQMSDPGDIIGLPHIDEKSGKTEFMLPYWFPVDGKPVVLFLDELNRARPEVLQTVMDLTLNRKLAGKTLPAGSRIISAVNNGSEYQLTDLDPALISRFNIYEFVPTVEDWLLWAENSGIDERITSFIRENPQFLDDDENSDEEMNDSFERKADRRSWERFSDITKNFLEFDDSLLCMAAGIVGNRAASLFFKFTENNKIPSVKRLMEGDFESYKKTLASLSIAEISSLNESIFRYLNSTENLKKEVSENLVLYFDFLGRLGKEFQSHFISLCSAERFPDALCYIMENAETLYKKMMNSISE